MRKHKDKAKKKGSKKPYSTIQAHKKQRNTLIPPLMTVPNVALQSWINDRLPEMIWSGLLISKLGREQALPMLRKLVAHVSNLRKTRQIVNPTLSGIASLEHETRQELLGIISSETQAKNALRPLLLFMDLP